MNQEDLIKYYNRNTSKFIFFQKDKGNKNIHQALWAEQSFKHNQAINYSNELVAKEINRLLPQVNESRLTVLDMGCGVGSSVFYLAEQFGQKTLVFGISISVKQIGIAATRNKILGKNEYCRFLENDFHHLSHHIPTLDLAYAIEAFVHSKNPAQFFQEVSKKLKPGGKLIIIDDFLHDRLENKSPDKKENKILRNFEYGWVLGKLSTVTQTTQLARQSGLQLQEEKDLTSFLKYRLRDRLIRLFVCMIPDQTSHEYLKSLVGGDARQRGIQKKLIQYKQLVFEKMEEGG